jgi:hypothetical protein
LTIETDFRIQDQASIPEPATKKEKPPMSKPTHIAYVVKDAKEGSDKPGIWRRVGSVWPHKNGNGFDVVIADQISVGGRIVCTPPKEKDGNSE